MTNSATSTDRRSPQTGTGFQAWHFFVLLSMAGATAAVMLSRETHPAALLLLSAAVICAGFVAVAINRAVSGFLSRGPELEPLPTQAREALEKEKALVLRSIKELEFDRAMGKVSDTDFTDIVGRLRARAMALMQDLDRAAAVPARAPVKAPAAAPIASASCPSCGTKNDADARFCKNCGAGLRPAETVR